VGRSSRRAYAYLTFTRGKQLTDIAQKRLETMRDFTEFGAGFKIAMRDMEIRGAGNILGAEQSGHMMSVGFDMYCRLIEEEVQRLSGAPMKKAKEEVAIDILCSAYLPEDYVGDKEIKISLYKRIAEIRDFRELKECIDEMEDRFGSVPDPVYHLFLVIRLKLLAEALGIVDVKQQKNGFYLTFDGLNNLGGDDIQSLFKEFGRHFEFAMGDRLKMTVRTGKLSEIKALLYTLRVLTFLGKRKYNKEDAS
jgi:transcription-repair coupling factor (superfamily II helicase)